ncbi:MAG: S8 family peptidase [Paludibacter sp.]
MRFKIIAFSIVLFFSIQYASAITKYYFYVQFANKNNTSFSLSNPSDYLSARAIARRTAFNIPIDSTDLPVNQTYVNQISNLGHKVYCRSKWMNGITVLVTDSSLMSQIRNLSFVKWAKYTGKVDVAQAAPRKAKLPQTLNYGTSATQLNMVNASYLHNLGYTGKNIHVAVLDAGFLNASNNVGFDSLRLQGRLLGTKDFTELTPNIYGSDSHGANVLSIMTGNISNQYLGAAPHASFWLIRTEYAPTEYVSETDFWVSGIEFADSVGVDVVNSSLGYTTFDDPVLNYTYANMNGTFSRASRAATLAAKKGIIVCNSAGNDGNKTWHYIGVPADAADIVTVGAAESTGIPSVFTSYGPTADNRIKPDLSAMGTSTAYINTSGGLSSGNGTSYASPIMAGMFACFLQYAKANFNNFTIQSLIQSAKQSANLYTTPTDRLGYGIPNFQTACAFLPAMLDVIKQTDKDIHVFQNNAAKLLIINTQNADNLTIALYSLSGMLLHKSTISNKQASISTAGFASGMYILQVSGNGTSKTQKIVIGK